MAKKTTINDIANSLGLSRNTVSRAINGGPGISEETKARILDEAVRLNYKLVGTRIAEPVQEKKTNIMLVTKNIHLITSRMFNFLMYLLQPLSKERDATITTCFLSPEEIDQCIVPSEIDKMDALIVIEILNEKYIQALLDCGKPTVMYDSTIDPDVFTGEFDIVAGNVNPITAKIKELAKQGKKRFGFVGDRTHCYGFNERFNAFRIGVMEYSECSHTPYDIIDIEKADTDYRKLFLERLPNMELPDVFLCANSHLAHQLANEISKLGIPLHDRVQVYGFGIGNYDESWLDENSDSYKEVEDLASSILMLIYDRLKNHCSKYRVVHTNKCVMEVTHRIE